MGDSWEDQAEVSAPATDKQNFSFNPTAASFSFNPTASSFKPPGDDTAPSPTPSAPPAAAASQPEQVPDDALAEVEAGVANVAVSEPPPSKPSPEKAPSAPKQEASTSAKAAEPAEEEAETEETEEDVAARRKVYEALSKEDTRIHMNVVFIGHVDAGKSTLGGQILCLMGGVDDRTIEKYQKEAKDNNRETWYMAYVMDTNDEERAKGKTVEVGRAHFNTDNKRYTILDAPGHKNFVPNMIQGASQADIGVLVISARKGEFETGYERGGQTREHALLAKTLGVQKLIVVINKMDDPSICDDGKWSKDRYDDIVSKLTPFLRSCGYNPAKDFVFCPLAALTGGNVLHKPAADICDWWDGPTLFEALDSTEAPPRDPMASFRMPIMDKYKDMGTVIMGKSESGVVQVGTALVMMPNAQRCKVTSVWRDDDEVQAAGPGENLRIRISGIDEDQVSLGFVLSGPSNRCPVVTKFACQLKLLELLEHKSIFTAGYKSILHIHSITEECEVLQLDFEMDLKTKQKKRCKFAKSNASVLCKIVVSKPICVEPFEVNAQMGRFTLRDEGKTIAIGKVTKLPPPGK